MSNFVVSQLMSGANMVVPGRSVGPGQTMPAYQGIPSARWDSAARGVGMAPDPRTIDKHIGFPSNDRINDSKVIQPWKGQEEELIREGQLMFARTVHVDKMPDMATEASMQHLQAIFRQGYRQARAAMSGGVTKEGVTLQQIEDLGEAFITENIDRTADEQLKIGNDVLVNACKLLKQSPYKYLFPGTALREWNFYGAVCNLSYSTSPESKINRSSRRTIVVNHTVAKLVFVSNIWGDTNAMAEGDLIGLIVRRATGYGDQGGHPEIIPWTNRHNTTPPIGLRGSFDSNGRFHEGYFIPIGHVTEIDSQSPQELKRRIAIGNSDRSPSVIHEALGMMPKIRVMLGV